MWRKLIVALDVDNKKKFKSIVNRLYPKVKKFKVGIIAYTALGEWSLNWLREKGAEVFLDLKFFDIPNTVCEASKLVLKKGVWAFTVHIRMGKETLTLLKRELTQHSRKLGLRRPKIFGVTILTSEKTTIDRVLKLTEIAYQAGLDGVVCSVWEAKAIKDKFKNLLVIAPGIRSRKEDDQERIATVCEAKSQGVDFFVVGRPIVKAKDPLKAAEELLKF